MAFEEGFHHLGVKVPVALFERLEQVAGREDRSLSAVTRRALEEYISANEKEESPSRNGTR